MHKKMRRVTYSQYVHEFDKIANQVNVYLPASLFEYLMINITKGKTNQNLIGKLIKQLY